MLGKTYLALKDKDKALLWLAKAKDYPGRTHEDKEVQQQQLKVAAVPQSQVLNMYNHHFQQVQKEAADLLKKL